MRTLLNSIFVGALIMVPVAAWNTDAAAQEKTAQEKASQKIQVLVVTGFDVASHQWEESTKLVQAILEETDRFKVTIRNDKEVFASPTLGDYSVVVLSYGFWKEADPSDKAKAGLLNYVKNGGNLVALHFACSSFQDWSEYGELLGRVWKKGVGGHGPYGPFNVNIKNAQHPITKGLEDFKTEDELYAKLSGEAEIEILASAYSDWSKQVEPIVFVKQYGKGRVVQNVLGHALDSKQNESYQKLLCRSVEWAATGEVAPAKTKNKEPADRAEPKAKNQAPQGSGTFEDYPVSRDEVICFALYTVGVVPD